MTAVLQCSEGEKTGQCLALRREACSYGERASRFHEGSALGETDHMYGAQYSAAFSAFSAYSGPVQEQTTGHRKLDGSRMASWLQSLDWMRQLLKPNVETKTDTRTTGSNEHIARIHYHTAMASICSISIMQKTNSCMPTPSLPHPESLTEHPKPSQSNMLPPFDIMPS